MIKQTIAMIIALAGGIADAHATAHLPPWLLDNYAKQQAIEEPQYEYSEATLANAPSWMKLNCQKREHRWAAYRHLYSMCR
jgi:hypothetical protein